jgi:Ca2+-binding RTX toxin-like protein
LGGGDNLWGGRGDDTVNGGDGADDIHGGADQDTLNGDAGDDTIDGDAGHDTIDGGAGDDTVIGSSGGDNAVGGEGTDTLDFSTDVSGVTVSLEAGTTSGIDIGDGTIVGFENVIGGLGDDTLGGTNQSDELSGRAGNDTIRADGGADKVDGGDGNDALYGGIRNDLIDGGSGNDKLVGGDGDDTMTGGEDKDTLIGGAGIDVMDGGGGHDIFKYTESLGASQSTGLGYDTLVGFDAANDRVGVWFDVTGVDSTIASGSLSDATFDADLAAAVNSNTMAASHAVLFTPDAGDHAGETYMIVDTNGTAGYQAGADLVIELDAAVNSNITVDNFA